MGEPKQRGPFRVGQRLTWRCMDGELVGVVIVRPGRLLSLVTYTVDDYFQRPGDCGPPRRVIRWRWNHRLHDHRAINAAASAIDRADQSRHV